MWHEERQQRSSWTFERELAAVSLERAEMWASLQSQLLERGLGLRLKKGVPGPMVVHHDDRPAGRAAGARPKTNDPAEIAAFFTRR